MGVRLKLFSGPFVVRPVVVFDNSYLFAEFVLDFINLNDPSIWMLQIRFAAVLFLRMIDRSALGLSVKAHFSNLIKLEPSNKL